MKESAQSGQDARGLVSWKAQSGLVETHRPPRKVGAPTLSAAVNTGVGETTILQPPSSAAAPRQAMKLGRTTSLVMARVSSGETIAQPFAAGARQPSLTNRMAW